MILALESSCDESALALFDPARGLTGEWVSSQVALHGAYGGVVPELAVREHLAALPALLREAEAHPDFGHVDALAVTVGPGLAGCLALGLAAAKALAVALDLPLIAVNHLRAHAWSVFISTHAEHVAQAEVAGRVERVEGVGRVEQGEGAAESDGFTARLEALLPHVGVLVSGGNTALFVIHPDRRIEVLGATIDDAAGEALDKGAKLLGLGYPGGPEVEKLALAGDARAFDFPRALPGRDNLDFSFSGLKTSLRYRVAGLGPDETLRRRPDLCASYQAAVVDVLVRKAGFALDGRGARSLGVSGGVANNRVLRARLEALAAERGVAFLPAQPKHTGDNAGMIAFAAWMEGASRGAGDARHHAVIEPALSLDTRPGGFSLECGGLPPLSDGEGGGASSG